MPPEVLSAFVLAQLKHDAERRIGPVQQAVITVPAFFDETRRKATQDAGRLAGLEVLDIINEPTAAALAYGYQQGLIQPGQDGFQGGPRRVLVYDLGGGTFDVTILELDGRQFRALATDGDVRLGGRDFDERLVEHIAEQYRQIHGLDPRADPNDAIQLWLEIQDCKHAISQLSKTPVVCNFGGLRARLEVTRQQFEEMTRDLLDRTETTTKLVVRDAGLDWDQIDTVLLVGGATRMPMVSEMLQRVTGKTPDAATSPDEAVAHGAALYAAMLSRDDHRAEVPACQLINVNSHSLGVVGIEPKTRRRVVKIVIPKNTPLPSRVERSFVTERDDQRNVKVPIVEGESRDPAECISLGECTVRDLPQGLAKGTAVKVELSYAANGRISVSARVARTRQSFGVGPRGPDAAVGARRTRPPPGPPTGRPEHVERPFARCRGRRCGRRGRRRAGPQGQLDRPRQRPAAAGLRVYTRGSSGPGPEASQAGRSQPASGTRSRAAGARAGTQAAGPATAAEKGVGRDRSDAAGFDAGQCPHRL